jgi:hypothetical protein
MLIALGPANGARGAVTGIGVPEGMQPLKPMAPHVITRL